MDELPLGQTMDDSQRLALAADIKREHPKWSIRKIAKAAGHLCAARCRDHLVEVGLLVPKKRVDSMIAPDWYYQPMGRIVAQRKAQGIEL